MNKDPFEGIVIPNEAKTKLERKLVELNFRMNGELTDDNRRQFVIFSLAIDNTVPQFLRKLFEKEREYAILQAKKLGYFTHSNSPSESDARGSVQSCIEPKSENYKIIYDDPLPVLRSILKKVSADDGSKGRKKHKKMKKVKFDLPDDVVIGDSNNQNIVKIEASNESTNTDQHGNRRSSSSKGSTRSTSSSKRSSTTTRHRIESDKNAKSNHNVMKKFGKNYMTIKQ